MSIPTPRTCTPISILSTRRSTSSTRRRSARARRHWTSSTPAFGDTDATMQPVTQYAKSGDIHIAYQAFGEGPINLVMVPGFVSNLENYWEEPDFARFLNHLASYARVVIFDKRGTGMSDRATELPGLDLRMDDLRA